MQSVSARKPYYGQQNSQVARKLRQNQTYQNVLNRLLRLNTLPIFVKESSRYVVFTENIVEEFKPREDIVRRSLKFTHALGIMLLQDGGFVRHYCHLLEQSGRADMQAIRMHIFKKFKDQVEIRKGMFFKYFAKEELLMLKQVKSKQGYSPQFEVNSQVMMSPTSRDDRFYHFNHSSVKKLPTQQSWSRQARRLGEIMVMAECDEKDENDKEPYSMFPITSNAQSIEMSPYSFGNQMTPKTPLTPTLQLPHTMATIMFSPPLGLSPMTPLKQGCMNSSLQNSHQQCLNSLSDQNRDSNINYPQGTKEQIGYCQYNSKSKISYDIATPKKSIRNQKNNSIAISVYKQSSLVVDNNNLSNNKDTSITKNVGSHQMEGNIPNHNNQWNRINSNSNKYLFSAQAKNKQQQKSIGSQLMSFQKGNKSVEKNKRNIINQDLKDRLNNFKSKNKSVSKAKVDILKTPIFQQVIQTQQPSNLIIQSKESPINNLQNHRDKITVEFQQQQININVENDQYETVNCQDRTVNCQDRTVINQYRTVNRKSINKNETDDERQRRLMGYVSGSNSRGAIVSNISNQYILPPSKIPPASKTHKQHKIVVPLSYHLGNQKQIDKYQEIKKRQEIRRSSGVVGRGVVGDRGSRSRSRSRGTTRGIGEQVGMLGVVQQINKHVLKRSNVQDAIEYASNTNSRMAKNQGIITTNNSQNPESSHKRNHSIYKKTPIRLISTSSNIIQPNSNNSHNKNTHSHMEQQQSQLLPIHRQIIHKYYPSINSIIVEEPKYMHVIGVVEEMGRIVGGLQNNINNNNNGIENNNNNGRQNNSKSQNIIVIEKIALHVYQSNIYAQDYYHCLRIRNQNNSNININSSSSNTNNNNINSNNINSNKNNNYTTKQYEIINLIPQNNIIEDKLVKILFIACDPSRIEQL